MVLYQLIHRKMARRASARVAKTRPCAEIARLDHRIDAGRLTLEQVEARNAQYRLAERVVAELGSSASYNTHRLEAHLTAHRNEIDGLPQPPAIRQNPVHHPEQMQPYPPAVQPPTPPPPQITMGM